MKLIKTCESRYGGTTCIYHYVNINQIVDLTIQTTSYEVNAEALLTNGMRVIILHTTDIKSLLSEQDYNDFIGQLKEKIAKNKAGMYE